VSSEGGRVNVRHAGRLAVVPPDATRRAKAVTPSQYFVSIYILVAQICPDGFYLLSAIKTERLGHRSFKQPGRGQFKWAALPVSSAKKDCTPVLF